MTKDGFEVGDIVTWTSQSQGSATTKIGRIAQIVPPHTNPRKEQWPQLFSGAGPGFARNHMSYIVTVGTRVYWPRANKLVLAPAQQSKGEQVG